MNAIWELCGTLTGEILQAQSSDADPRRLGSVVDSSLPRTFVRWVIVHERVERLEDLVERRLMLLYSPQLSRRTLDELADLLVESGRLSAEQQAGRRRQGGRAPGDRLWPQVVGVGPVR